ncbi:hypothetical protein L9F63_000456, partial [Diploptera punctata]
TLYPRGGTNGRKKCACMTPLGFLYTRLEPDERRMQRQFLRGHVNKDIKDYRPKFLRTFHSKQPAEVDLPDFLRQASGVIDSSTVVDLITRYNNEQLRKASRRGKRDTLDHLTDSIMKDIEKDIEKELHGLKIFNETPVLNPADDGTSPETISMTAEFSSSRSPSPFKLASSVDLMNFEVKWLKYNNSCPSCCINLHENLVDVQKALDRSDET